jgi:hypothetical protein
MKNFDENGNFSPPLPELAEEEVVQPSFWIQETTSLHDVKITITQTQNKETR